MFSTGVPRGYIHGRSSGLLVLLVFNIHYSPVKFLYLCTLSLACFQPASIPVYNVAMTESLSLACFQQCNPEAWEPGDGEDYGNAS